MADCELWKEVFAIIGIIFVVILGIKILWVVTAGLITHFFSKLCKPNLPKKYGEWAVVTGCTDGIGKAYAEELARRKMNIVLVSRSMDKLQATAQLFESKYSVETQIIQVDFTEGRRIYDKIATELAGKDIGILVNNVGLFGEKPESYIDTSEDMAWNTIIVNCGSVAMMTKIILPGMLQRKRGAIVNVCSGAGFFPTPMMTIYSSSKAFVDFISRALQYELSGSGVEVQCLIPYMVKTGLTAYAHDTKLPLEAVGLLPEPSTYARNAVSTLGVSSHTTGHWAHALEHTGATILPERVWLWISSSFISMLAKKS